MISAESIRATDDDLAGRSAAGDQTAFAEIYERYFDRIFDFVARTMRDSESAGDVTQNAFLKAWNGLRRRGAPDNLKAWLFAIARNEAIDEFRRRRLEVSLDGEENSIPAGVETDTSRTADPEAMTQDREVAGLVWRAASALSPKEYALLDMHLRQELGAEEIAGCLGVRTGNVYTMLSRLRGAVEETVVFELLRRSGRSACPELDVVLTRFETGSLTPAMRRAVKKHLNGCEICQESRHRLASPSTLFASLAPIVPAPGLKDSLWAGLQDRLPAPPASGGPHVPPGPAGRAGNRWWTAPVLERIVAVGGVLGVVAAVLIGIIGVASSAAGVRDPDDAVSTSHMIGAASTERRITIRWTAQRDVRGYSIVWDGEPATLPDRIVDLAGDAGGATSDSLKDGGWFFHLRTQGQNGSWTSTLHLGPYMIEAPVTVEASPAVSPTAQPASAQPAAAPKAPPVSTAAATPTLTAPPAPTAAPPATSTSLPVPASPAAATAQPVEPPQAGAGATATPGPIATAPPLPPTAVPPPPTPTTAPPPPTPTAAPEPPPTQIPTAAPTAPPTPPPYASELSLTCFSGGFVFFIEALVAVSRSGEPLAGGFATATISGPGVIEPTAAGQLDEAGTVTLSFTVDQQASYTVAVSEVSIDGMILNGENASAMRSVGFACPPKIVLP